LKPDKGGDLWVARSYGIDPISFHCDLQIESLPPMLQLVDILGLPAI
jgi:hypothetical protein